MSHKRCVHKVAKVLKITEVHKVTDICKVTEAHKVTE